MHALSLISACLASLALAACDGEPQDADTRMAVLWDAPPVVQPPASLPQVVQSLIESGQEGFSAAAEGAVTAENGAAPEATLVSIKPAEAGAMPVASTPPTERAQGDDAGPRDEAGPRDDADLPLTPDSAVLTGRGIASASVAANCCSPGMTEEMPRSDWMVDTRVAPVE